MMAKSNELNVDVNVRLSVSDDMAERCIQLLAMYLDDNPEKTLLMECNEDKKHRGRIVDLTAPAREEALVIAHVSDIPCYTERIWLEARGGSLLHVEYKRWGGGDADYIYFLVQNGPNNEVGWRVDTYNSDWRCWTKKPTLEQRKAVKWYEA